MARIQERILRRREVSLNKEIENARRSAGVESPEMQRLIEEKIALTREREKSRTAR
jgi:hypothetical protein